MTGKRKILLVLAVLWTCVIWGMSLQPAEVSSDFSSGIFGFVLKIFFPGVWEQIDVIPVDILERWHTIFRKCAHFTEYFVQGGLWSMVLQQNKSSCKNYLAVIICVLTALIDEMGIQRFVPGRSGQLSDVVLDSVGAILGVLFICAIGIALSRRQKGGIRNDF